MSCCVPADILRVLIVQTVSVHAYESERGVLKCALAYNRRFDHPEVTLHGVGRMLKSNYKLTIFCEPVWASGEALGW